MAEKRNLTLDGGLRLCQCNTYAVGSNDFVEDDTSSGLYCSSYCRRFYGENMEKVNPVGKDGKVSKHHTGIKVYPKLDQDCDYCGTHMFLTYSNATKNGSKRFCGRDCYYAMLRSRRKVKPRWGLLRSLQQRGPLNARELSYILNRWEYSANPRTVGGLLRVYILKNIVTKDSQGNYHLTDDRPVGWLAAHE